MPLTALVRRSGSGRDAMLGLADGCRSFQSATEKSGLADLYDSNRQDAAKRRKRERPPILPESAWRRTLFQGPAVIALPSVVDSGAFGGTSRSGGSLSSRDAAAYVALQCCSQCLHRSNAFRARQEQRQLEERTGKAPVRRPRHHTITRIYPPVVPLPPAVMYDQPAIPNPTETAEARRLFRDRAQKGAKLIVLLAALAVGAAYSVPSVYSLASI